MLRWSLSSGSPKARPGGGVRPAMIKRIALRGIRNSLHYRPNSRSISQPSNPVAASGRTEVRVGAGLAAPLAACGAVAVGGEGALTCEAVCTRFENKPLDCEFGSAATGTPWWAARMKRVQTATGNPPPVAFLVGELSSLPSQTPVTRLAV